MSTASPSRKGSPNSGMRSRPPSFAAIVHEELDRLSDLHRQAVVLCDLEELTHEQAAARLGWPVGTVKSRLARGRERLRARLIRARGGAGLLGLIATVAGGSEALAPSLPPAGARFHDRRRRSGC